MISNPSVFGSNYENFVDNTTFSTGSTTDVVAAGFTTGVLPIGTYRVQFNWLWRISSAASSAIFGIYLNGTQFDNNFHMEISDTAANERISNNWVGYINVTAEASYPIELRVRNEAGLLTTEVFIVRAEIWRVN